MLQSPRASSLTIQLTNIIQPDSLQPQGHLVMFQRATYQGQTGLELELCLDYDQNYTYQML